MHKKELRSKGVTFAFPTSVYERLEALSQETDKSVAQLYHEGLLSLAEAHGDAKHTEILSLEVMRCRRANPAKVGDPNMVGAAGYEYRYKMRSVAITPTVFNFIHKAASREGMSGIQIAYMGLANVSEANGDVELASRLRDEAKIGHQGPWRRNARVAEKQSA